MAIASKSRLQAIMTAHESEIAREQERIDQAHLEDVLFAEQFVALKKNVLLPAFGELESELKQHGHVCRIIEFDEIHPRADDGGGARDGSGDSVRCEFYPKGWDYGEGVPLAGPPSITVTCDKKTRAVKLSECTFGPLDRGWSGEIGSCGLQDLTRERLTEVFVAMVEKIPLDKSFIAKSMRDLRPSWTRPGTRYDSRPRLERDRRATLCAVPRRRPPRPKPAPGRPRPAPATKVLVAPDSI